MNSILKAQENFLHEREGYNRLPRPLSVEQGLSVAQPSGAWSLRRNVSYTHMTPPSSPTSTIHQKHHLQSPTPRFRSQVSRDRSGIPVDVQEGSDSEDEVHGASPRAHRKRRSRAQISPTSCSYSTYEHTPYFQHSYSPPASPRLSFVSRLRGWSLVLSLSCFIGLLLWEIYTLHHEVYALRDQESSHKRRSRAPRASGSALLEQRHQLQESRRDDFQGKKVGAAGVAYGGVDFFKGNDDESQSIRASQFDVKSAVSRRPLQTTATEAETLLMDPVIAAQTARALATKAAALTNSHYGQQQKQQQQQQRWQQQTVDERPASEAQSRLSNLFTLRDEFRQSAHKEYWQSAGKMPDYMENPGLLGQEELHH